MARMARMAQLAQPVKWDRLVKRVHLASLVQ
jgi:hypothetical protein